MAPAIVVENVSKKYRLTRGEERLPYRTLRDDLVGLATWPARYLRGQTSRKEDFWALNDVSFEVQPGEVVGIIGRNGAGKSTLLKVLSRITRPTTGRVRLRGRVGSLLEVGTGFHPELTGRENIYLSGAVLGMKRAETRRKFDEIVAFAEVEKFLDMPVKRYSSGMYVRLAFAVAAHLEPEILLVDEVLAVGDAAFQKKCLGRMGDIASGGRTVIFVSHNMAAVQNLCTDAVLLTDGKLIASDSVSVVISKYMRQFESSARHEIDLRKHNGRKPGAEPIISRLQLSDGTGRRTDTFPAGGKLVIEMELQPNDVLTNPSLGVGVSDQIGNRLFTVGTYYSAGELEPITNPTSVRCDIPELPLAPGQYWLTLGVGVSEDPSRDWIQHAACFYVVEADYFRCGRNVSVGQGSFLVRSQWSITQSKLLADSV